MHCAGAAAHSPRPPLGPSPLAAVSPARRPAPHDWSLRSLKRRSQWLRAAEAGARVGCRVVYSGWAPGGWGCRGAGLRASRVGRQRDRARGLVGRGRARSLSEVAPKWLRRERTGRRTVERAGTPYSAAPKSFATETVRPGRTRAGAGWRPLSAPLLRAGGGGVGAGTGLPSGPAWCPRPGSAQQFPGRGGRTMPRDRPAEASPV